MRLQTFIQHNREQLDTLILARCPGIRLNDNERRLWVLNDEGLYLWAKEEGVPI